MFADRDLDDFQDVYRCLDTSTGRQLWQQQVLAIGSLDYGNSSRATPLVDGDRVFLSGAFGDLLAVELATGEVKWKRHLKNDFGVTAELPWGYCGSLLLIDGKLIVQPGANEASLVALDPASGKVLWKTAGEAPSYGSLIAGRFGGKLQIVGHDANSLGGWDIATGERLWKLTPQIEGDFNVPTPIEINGKLLVTTENNGTRLYGFADDGSIDPEPVMTSRRLAPDMSTPVVVGNRVFCVHRTLIGLDLNDKLREVNRHRDAALGDYGSIIASDTHVLVVGKGELLLVDVREEPQIASRCKVFDEKVVLFSHPALVGERLYIRGENSIKCILLSQD